MQIEWITIPGGAYRIGLSADEKASMLRRVREAYGVDRLSQAARQLVETLCNKTPFDSLSEREEEFSERYMGFEMPLFGYKIAVLTLQNEIPDAKMVCVPSFQIARYPITQAQAKIWRESLVAKKRKWKDSGADPEALPDRPAQFPLWEEANALARWLGGRLPSAEEWEIAARGDDQRLYPWGNEWNPEAGHFGSRKNWAQDPPKRRGRFTAVDAFPEGASPYGVIDMLGNLGEWTSTLRDKDTPICTSCAIKEMPAEAQFFWALPQIRHPASFKREWFIPKGCRPVLIGGGSET